MYSRRPPDSQSEKGKRKGTFDFLGFTHYWAKSRRGNWVVKRKTVGKRLVRTVKTLWRWCRENRHRPVREQYKMLVRKLRGYYQYYGIRGNYRCLEKVYRQTMRAWWYWLSRRSHKRAITWTKFIESIADLRLLRPRIVHNI